MPASALLLVLALQRIDASANETVQVVRQWMQAANEHQPGKIDRPLLTIAKETPAHFDMVRRHLREAIKVDLPSTEARNALLKRGAILHTDIALLLPQQAGTFTFDDLPTAVDPYSGRVGVRRQTNALVFSADGEYVARTEETAHWWMARLMLSWILPHPSEDPFVALWYRAITAWFSNASLFGNATYHLREGLGVLPRDPILLFYSGAIHEAYASPLIQSIPLSRPAAAQRMTMPRPDKEWGLAEAQLRESLDAGGPIEARVRLGRVLGRLGRHAEAAETLRLARPQITDRRLQYFADLFLGSEEGALNRVEDARASFERAAALFPTAQSPLLALSEVLDRSGDRTAAIGVLERLARLPADPESRDDPWRDYVRSFAWDAEALMTSLRAAVDAKEPR